MKRPGLRFKILSGLALISFLTMGALIAILHVYLDATLEDQLFKRGRTIASVVAEQSISPLLGRESLKLDLLLNDCLKMDGDIAYIFLEDTKDRVLSHTFGTGFPSDLKMLDAKTRGAYHFSRMQLGGKEIVDISVPVMKGMLGNLHVGLLNGPVKKEIHEILLTVTVVIIVLFILAALAMGLYLEKTTIRPVTALREQVRLVGEGNFEVIADILSEDEIGSLGRAFNEMGGKLNQLYTEMAERGAEMARLNEQLAELATTDGLTGLHNHRYFYERLTEEVKRAKRYQHPLSLIMADIDLFKRYNDTLGHVAGDKALKIIAKLMSENARENDQVARYGGEEIAVILPETNIDTARLVAERMRTIIEFSPELAAIAIRPGESLTMSFGVAQLDEATESAKGFVRLADAMLYHAKALGRNRVES